MLCRLCRGLWLQCLWSLVPRFHTIPITLTLRLHAMMVSSFQFLLIECIYRTTSYTGVQFSIAFITILFTYRRFLISHALLNYIITKNTEISDIDYILRSCTNTSFNLRKPLYVGHIILKWHSSLISVFWLKCISHIGRNLFFNA